MHQIIQDLKSGETILKEVPTPQVGAGKVLIKTHRSLVSLGTERMLVSFGQANLIEKARQQPERVKEVMNKMKTDGIKPTFEAVLRKLDTPMPLGYSNAGKVIAVGKGVTKFKVGDRVASNGNHAEVVAVPENLIAKIPDNVDYEEAAFTVIGAIALQGIRLLKPSFGEMVVVLGLGLVGLIAVQLLKAHGCKVIGLDVDEDKLKIARKYGISTADSTKLDPVQFVLNQTDQVGADGVLITASSKSNAIISQSAHMSRKRGRIVLVGVVGLDIDRADFYEKELSFQVSCSYGPGRYDDNYEQKGQDYPLPYVRWTEKRNFEAILEAIQANKLDVKSLITEQIPIENFHKIYSDISNSKSVASILEYTDLETSQNYQLDQTIRISDESSSTDSNKLAVIGAGNFTQSTLLPSLSKLNVPVKYIVSSAGLSSTNLAQKYNIEHSTTDIDTVLNDDDVQSVIITTRHNLHASMTMDALNAGKHVFVEKPLALNQQELKNIISVLNTSRRSIMVGFNRRFSPHALKMKELLGDDPGPMNIIATMNAGYLPPDSWLNDMDIGGGRIIGEACHYVDLITFLTGSKVKAVYMQAMGNNPRANTDNATITLKYKNGSLGVINYFANGHKSYAKERVEVFYQGKNIILDNFRKLYGYGYEKSFLSNRLLKTKQDKGHAEQFRRLVKNWKECGMSLIPIEDIINTHKAIFGAITSLKGGKQILL